MTAKGQFPQTIRPGTEESTVAAADAEAVAWLLALSEGKVGADEERRFQCWMEASEVHRERFAELSATWHWSFDALQEFSLYGSDRRELPSSRDLRMVPARSLHRADTSLRSRVGVVLAAALAAALVALAIRHGFPEMPPERTIVASGPGAPLELELTDGSRISLNGNSRLTYRLDSETRDLELIEGEAYFKVARDGRPLQVRTPAGSVRVLGTAFNIDLLEEGVAEVSVFEGTVQVDSGVQPIRLNVGEMVEVRPGAPLHRRASSDAAVDWREGWFDARDASLSRVLHEASRYSKLKIELGDPALKRMRLSGRIRISEPERVIAMLEHAYGLRVRRESGRIVLVSGDDRQL